MSSDDLIRKIWEIEEEIREKQLQQEELKRKLRELRRGYEGTLKQVASSRIASDYGVFSYDLKFDKTRFEFQALDKEGNSQMWVRWQWAKKPQMTELGLEQISVKIEKIKPHQELEFDCDKSKSVLTIDGTSRSLTDLEDPKTALIVHEYHKLFEDFLVGVVKDMERYRTTRTGEPEVTKMKKALDLISSIACVCSSFGWIGLAICGPTCLGTVIAQAADP